MKRICILCESWESGGIEAFLYNVITHIDRSELEIDLVAAQLKQSPFTQSLQTLGVQFYQLSGSTRKVLQNHRLFRKLLVERQYDVLHLNAYQGLSLAYLKLARKEGVFIRIAHSHNTALRASLTRSLKLAIHNWAKMQYTKEATALWACSKSAAKFLFSKPELDKAGYVFIPNGIDMQRFYFNPNKRQEVREKLGLSNKFVIGNVGRLCYQKNQEFLLDVFYEVTKHRPESVLLLVGEGPDQPRLEEKARRLGVINSIIFYGVTTQVEQLYWAIDVYVMPSRFEGLPVTGIEAQTASLLCFFSERITKECALGDRAVFLPLEAGATYWAEILLKIENWDRQIGMFHIMENIFEIRMVAKKIRCGWIMRKEELPKDTICKFG